MMSVRFHARDADQARHDEGRYAEARKCLEEAVRRFPAVPMAPHSLGVLDLLEGRYEPGWRGFTWREVLTKYEMHHKPQPPVGYCPPIPSETVEAIDVVGEQGLGDMVFFARWAPRLKEMARGTHLHGDPRLEAILARTGAFDGFGSKDDWQHSPGALAVARRVGQWIDGQQISVPSGR